MMQALGLEVLQLLQCLLKHNPGLINEFTLSIQGVEGPAALKEIMPGIWQGTLVSCMQAASRLQDMREVEEMYLLSHILI